MIRRKLILQQLQIYGFIEQDKKWESKFQKAYQICLDQNPLIYLKEYLIRVANLNQNLMQTRGDAITDINAALS